ncbi:exonuclease SbcC [Tissierella praeacuta DSM 18095]|uniref:Exonuclease SbcC n=1 Tax=Tissierella praeacuta DSM 18095 TaxID=1123404 RepID=A0A1M4ULD7_9FIRM|nr:AAA family ATPase [Tissierella praeacuta]TCU68924.1 exonuclease SbcC [Tissierella praeacuta]SHE57592.1 exonuclease SbcC [Tissierella praeacuta DSM 18095]SUP03568.1 chromosome segregation protein [Tissierella praeacuta]
MYIKSYESTRFAGLKDISLGFDRGVNVILGPNESGKSTIIEGIHSTLFKDIKLKRNNNLDKEFLFKFMPQPNGDFINGKVVIEYDNGEYEIYKEWGNTENIHLLTPNGTIIKNENDIKEELSKILTHGESTYSNIVFAKQRDLKRALFNIINNREITNEINDLLRRTMMELDGISIDTIQKNIEDEIDSLYKRWNREKNYPENNRGVNNPYKTGLGKILESYYNKENLKLLMERADESEKEFEDICNKIKELENKIKLLSEKKLGLEKIEDDVNNRMILDAEISSINKDLEDFSEANREWPKTEQLLEQLDEKILVLKEKRKKLNKEKDDLEKSKKREVLERKLKNIEEIQEKINYIINELSTIPIISSDDIDKLSKIQTELLTLDTTMKAGKMIGILKKSSDKPLYISRDFREREVLDLGNPFEANGVINISYDNELEMEIKTGDLDFQELNDKYKSSKKEYNQLLHILKIDTIETGKLNLQKIKRLENEKISLNKQLEFILDKDTKEELEEELKELENIKVFRDLDEIHKELTEINEEELDILANKKNKTDLIVQWKEKYTDHDNLFDLVIDKKTILKDKRSKLEKLKPLPEEFTTADEFKINLILIREELNSAQGDLDKLKSYYYEAKNNLLDTSFEELREEYLHSESIFKRNIQRGEKLLEIQKVFLKTKEELSSNPMEPLAYEFARLLEIITDGKYKTGDIDEEFNIKLQNLNGEIPVELLSAGTYDSVTLALRFSLLKHIFKGKTGYVILDDCLVDLDPKRKDQSIKLINDFAKEYQVIFTTCDPETAKMLGGNIIKI